MPNLKSLRPPDPSSPPSRFPSFAPPSRFPSFAPVLIPFLRPPSRFPSFAPRPDSLPSHEHVKGFLSKCAVLKTHLLSNTLFAGVYVWTFQPGSSTGWGSEGVKMCDPGFFTCDSATRVFALVSNNCESVIRPEM